MNYRPNCEVSIHFILTNRKIIGEKMKVSLYVEQIINSRPYKYSTKQTIVKDVKRMGVWDMEIESISSGLIMDRVDRETNHNSRRRLFITARSVFKELGVCQDLPKLESSSKIYDIPSQEHLDWLIDQSKYRLQLFLCMYGGLRVGEACAVTPEKIEGDYLDVNEAYSQDGLHLGSPKTYGKVLLPSWLAEEVRNMKPEQCWKIGMTTKMVSGSIYKLSHNKKWKTLTGGKSVNPHMLRHWYATDMIQRGVNPEIVRRQMRHKNVSTTLKIYTQVRSEEIERSLPTRIVGHQTSLADNVIRFPITNESA